MRTNMKKPAPRPAMDKAAAVKWLEAQDVEMIVGVAIDNPEAFRLVARAFEPAEREYGGRSNVIGIEAERERRALTSRMVEAWREADEEGRSPRSDRMEMLGKIYDGSGER